MPKQITSTDWHLEGVSVETRKYITLYANLHNLTYGAALNELIKIVQQHVKLL
jgi:hypothetical protein